MLKELVTAKFLSTQCNINKNNAKSVYVPQPLSAISKPKTRIVLLLIALSWAISLTISLIPLSMANQDVFVRKAKIIDNPFFGNTVNFSEAKSYAETLLTYSPEMSAASEKDVREISNAKSWSDVEKFFSSFPTKPEHLKFSAFYG